MFKNRKLASTFVRKIKSAERLVTEDIAEGLAQQEPAITDRFIAYIQSEMRRSKNSPFAWSAMTLTDRGPGSQEKDYGADFVGSLEINHSGFRIRKGFLAQAKKVEPGQSFSNTEFKKLRDQCSDMLSLSPDSFVFLYSLTDGFSVVPAIAVMGARKCNPHELTSMTTGTFFHHHFECFIGDQEISLAKVQTLELLYEKYRARAGIHIVIGAEDDQHD